MPSPAFVSGARGDLPHLDGLHDDPRLGDADPAVHPVPLLRLAGHPLAPDRAHFFGGAFGTFLLRQFFLAIPSELEDAATIDGCTRFRIYWRIMMPLAKPALATLAVFTFMGSWNNLLGPVIYLTSRNKLTLTVGLAFFRGQYDTSGPC